MFAMNCIIMVPGPIISMTFNTNNRKSLLGSFMSPYDVLMLSQQFPFLIRSDFSMAELSLSWLRFDYVDQLDMRMPGYLVI